METLEPKFVSTVKLVYIRSRIHMSVPENILSGARSLFMRYGIKSITMDDVARELGISKKTLYQHVDNKADLVKKVMESHIEQEKEFSQTLSEKADNSIHEMLLVFEHIAQHMRKASPGLIYDLQRYYPEAWKVQTNFKNKFIYECIVSNIERGVKEGFYRQNLKKDIIARFYINSIEVLMDQNVFPLDKYTFLDTYTQFIQYHIHGLLTDKGKVIFEQSFKSN